MKNLFKNVGLLAFSFIFIILVAVFWPKEASKDAQIISTSFVGYDFARAIVDDKNNVSMLMKPGAEMHEYEPTPQDIINIKNAKLFIYIGGESEEWVENLLADNDVPAERRLRLMDFVDLKVEEEKEGMETKEEGEEEEYDEHIWTSIPNAIKMINAIREKLSSITAEKGNIYKENADSYIARLSAIDKDIRATVAAKNNRTLIFGDRFPFRYFVDEYGLDYYAAFPGCSDQTEASANTISVLTKKAKELGAKAIFKIEMTNDRLAKTIAEEVGAEVYTLHAAHNISEEEFNGGLSYADIMEKNAETLKEAL